MSSGSQGRDGDEVSFFKAVGIGAIWGLLPGVILGIAYAFTPSSKGISDVLYTTFLFTIKYYIKQEYKSRVGIAQQLNFKQL
jgi:hypothetical protein